MKLVFLLTIVSCVLFEARGYPYPYFSSSGDLDTWSYGGHRSGGMVLTRSHDPYRRAVRGGPTTYALRQPEDEVALKQSSHYHLADRRRQALLEVNDTPPQQNDVYYPELPESPAAVPIDSTELAEPIEEAEVTPTTKTVSVPDVLVSEVEESKKEAAEQPIKPVSNVKQVKKPVDEDEEDEDESYPNHPRIPTGGFFPMFFGWASTRSGSGSSGPIAIANAFSTGKGGVSASDATAYGIPRPLAKA